MSMINFKPAIHDMIWAILHMHTVLFTCGEAYRSRRAFDSVVRPYVVRPYVVRHFIICGSG